MKKLYFISLIVCLAPIILLAQTDIRIACIGNSITDGVSMSTAQYDAYPAALDRYLGEGYDVGNFGYWGRTMLKHGDYPLWNEDIFSDAIDFNPNIVTILLGTNDSKPYNWIYKDEFITDYIAMIDTFKQCEANPDIYVCLPLPSFSDAFDIRDSVIVNDIIPMINQIADSADVNLIDLYTPFLDKSDLMPDGIHPLIDGSDYLAQILLDSLTGRTVENQHENNLALHKSARITFSIYSKLTDGDTRNYTEFSPMIMVDPFLIDLADLYEFDMTELIFSEISDTSFNILIEVSSDFSTWNTVIDSTVSTNGLLSSFYASFPSVQAQYVNIFISGISNNIKLNEIRIYESRSLHAPVVRWEYNGEYSTSMKSQVRMARVTNENEYLKIYRQKNASSPFEVVYGYRSGDPLTVNTNIPFGETVKFYAVALKNDTTVSSDTLAVLGQSMTAIEHDSKTKLPEKYSLEQNYPNPFNPLTTISYTVRANNYSPLQHVDLSIYNILGQKVATLKSENQKPGTYSVTWDATGFSSGIYFCNLMVSGKTVESRKMVLMR